MPLPHNARTKEHNRTHSAAVARFRPLLCSQAQYSAKNGKPVRRNRETAALPESIQPVPTILPAGSGRATSDPIAIGAVSYHPINGTRRDFSQVAI